MKSLKEIRKEIGQKLTEGSVEQGVKDYIKIGKWHIDNHKEFKDLYKRQKSDFMYTTGPKYIKIFNTEMGQKRSIHAFIDKQTGDVLKPAGYNAPYKGGAARGNVLDKNYLNSLKRFFSTHGGHLYARKLY
jgi:hypothetical protein|tara:strand:- start:1622 stop:2014 length:393 start_codon:yes stop_codon:yes gene_type:complete